MKKKLLSMVVAGMMAVSFSISAMAAVPEVVTERNVSTFANGDYAVETISVVRSVTRNGRGEDYARKIFEYVTNDGVMWVFEISGDFTWDGVTAEASNADYDYDIYGNWNFVSGSARASGASVKGSGTFKSIWGTKKTKDMTLTCSPDGSYS